MARKTWESWGSWSSDVRQMLDQAAGSSLGRQGPSGARIVREGAASTPGSWGTRVIMTGVRMTPRRETGTHRARLMVAPAMEGLRHRTALGVTNRRPGLPSHALTQRRDSFEGPRRAAGQTRQEGRLSETLVVAHLA